MADQMTLDSILDEKPVEKIDTPVVDSTPPPEKPDYTTKKKEWRDKEQEAQGRVRDKETGQYTPKEVKEEVKEPVKEEVKAPEVKPEVKPVEEYSAREKAAFSKAADETRKRQALERQLAELQKEPPKPFYDDPEGALARHRAEQKQELDQAILATRVQTSESIAKSRYKDYDEKFAIFNELVQKSPYLAEQAFTSPDPAEFAYQTGATEKNLREAGGVENMRQKMEADLRVKIKAELEAELQKKKEDLEKDRAALPGSLTDVQSKGNNRPVWGGPPTLDDVLKG